MIVRSGFQIIEFERTIELPEPLTFESQDDALKLLKHLGFLDPPGIYGIRECLRRFSDDRDGFRLTDYEAAERMAALLYSGKVAAVTRQSGGGSGMPTQNTPAAVVAFPLSERAQRTPTASSRPAPAAEPATFDSKVDSVAQAAALVASAEAGTPFCPQ